MLQRRMAWHTVKYRHEQPTAEQSAYAAAETAAKARGLGLWSEPSPQEPSECRDLRKQRQKCR